MMRLPPGAKRTYPLFPYTPLVRSVDAAEDRARRNPGAPEPRAERPAGGRREPGAAPVGAPLGQPQHHASFAGAAAEIEIGHLDAGELGAARQGVARRQQQDRKSVV